MIEVSSKVPTVYYVKKLKLAAADWPANNFGHDYSQQHKQNKLLSI